MFRSFARKVATVSGSVWAFGLALLVVVAWAVSGPVFQFSTTWQLVINTGTTIVTFLMVFLIQNAQNSDTASVHIKLDEIIKALDNAHNKVLNAENLSQEELDQAREEYQELAEKESK